MFDSLIRICNNTKKLNENKLLKEIFNDPDIQGKIIELNKEQMYSQGLDSRGNSLGEYSEVTKKIKQKKNQRIDHITLKDSGAFYNSIKIKSGPKAVIVNGDMKKEGNDLEERWPKALGLTNENLSEIQRRISPILRRFILQDIFG